MSANVDIECLQSSLQMSMEMSKIYRFIDSEQYANIDRKVGKYIVHFFRTTCKCQWKCKCDNHCYMRTSMEMPKIYRYTFSARELHVDSVGTDSSKCRC